MFISPFFHPIALEKRSYSAIKWGFILPTGDYRIDQQ